MKGKKMNASSFDVEKLILGTSGVGYKDVPSDVWLHVIRAIYRREEIVNMPGLFRKVGDLASGSDTFITRVPKGRTTFVEGTGIGMNTLVRRVPHGTRDYASLVADPKLHQFRDTQTLLLIKPEERMPFVWGMWEITSLLYGEDGEYVGKVHKSKISFVSEEKLLKMFAENPGTPYFLCNIYPEFENYASEMSRRAYQTAKDAQWLHGVLQRMR